MQDGNGHLISSQTLVGVRVLIHAGIEINPSYYITEQGPGPYE